MTDAATRRRLLVTGHTGFVGQALQGWLPGSRWGERYEMVVPSAAYDLREPDEVRRMVAEARPDDVLHLAAQSFVPAAFRDPAGTLAVNLNGTLHLLQALKAEGFGGRLLYVSSADVYGAVPEDELPVTEARLPAPRNPYAVSKAAAELLCRQWHLTEGTDVLIARPFNHTGPGQDERFVLSDFARRVARIAAGRDPARLETGDLDVTRDFSDVRDVLDAYMALFAHGRAGETYNVCSGTERRVADLLRAMLAQAGVQAEVLTDPARLRPNEQRRMRGSAARLTAETGWQPRCNFDETLAALVAWWRAKEH